MSRRSALTPVQSQQRAASRMTVGTRMWSEQPVREIYDRFRLQPAVAAPPEPDPWYPPTGARYINISLDAGPAEMWVTLNAGEQCIMVVSTDPGQPQTIGAGWTILTQRSLGGMSWVIVTRTALVNETTLLSSVGPETHPWNKFTGRGFAYTGLSPLKFTPNLIAETISPTVTLHAWQGAWSAYRMRVLVTRGCYNNWMTPGSGHGALDLGFIDPRPSWLQGTWWDPPVYMKEPFPAGNFTHDSIGVSGVPTWAEYHIEVGRP